MARVALSPSGLRRLAAPAVVLFLIALMAGCNSGTAPQPPALSITTSTLPNGQVSTPYSATLVATGGTAPYTWSVSSGTLPAGLTLAASTGAISGTPAAALTGASLTFSVSDSGTPAQRASAALSLTIKAAAPPVSVSIKRAAVVVQQSVSISADAGSGNSVTWSASGSGCSGNACGTFSASTSQSGAAITYTAPAIAGTYTLTATSSADASKTATISVAATDLTAVPTWHDDISRDGANTHEYALTTSTVASGTFGKLFSCTVDGAVYTQPLWIPNLSIGGTTHNVVFVATQHDGLYAFDADSAPSGCAPLWHANLIDAAHGATAGESPVPSGGAGSMVGYGNGDIVPEVGVTGTPVIDPATNTLYVVSKSVIVSSAQFYQRLHAIDLLTGNEKFSGPVTIAATFPGSADGGTAVTFSPGQENQRTGLALANGNVYIAWASHEDKTPYYGWVLAYDAHTLAQVAVFNTTPDQGWGGIWMGGAAPSVDSNGNLYMITGNGTFDAANTSGPNHDYGDSMLKLTSSLQVAQYFTPSDQESDQTNDNDFGSGGTAILVDLPANGTNPTHLIIGGGKDGALYVLNRDQLGGLGDTNAWQRVDSGTMIFSTGAFWNNTYYIAGGMGPMKAFDLNLSSAQINSTSTSSSSNNYPFKGATPSISASGNSNGILWALDNGLYCTHFSSGCGPTVLHAYDAANLSKELWNSSQNPNDAAGNAVKFTVPTIANGRVYIGTRGNNTGGADSSTSVPGELDVYGILPN